MSRKVSPVASSDLPYTLFRRAAVPPALIALICVVLAAAISGRSGFVGAAVGALIVAAFYLSDLGLLRAAERLPGQALMPIMLTWYLLKVGILAIFMAALWGTTAFSMRAMAITVTVATVVWTGALALTASRAAVFVVDAPSPSQTRGPAA